MAKSKVAGWKISAAFGAVLVLGTGLILYDRLWREHPQPDWIVKTEPGESFGDTQFKYLSLGSERNAGIPFWVFYVLPAMFPEKLPGLGGYGAFGLPWEDGVELPIGLTKRVIGYPRVGINCALCHTTRYRKAANKRPVFEPTGPGHTANVEALSRFFYECAKDPRFNSDNILAEMMNFTKLDWIDRLLYRFVIIPAIKRRIIRGGEHFLWTYRSEPSAWGRGSDGPMYSRVYVRDDLLVDGHFGSNQFPAVWNLAKYQGRNGRGEPQRLNATGDGSDAYTVVFDSIVALLGPGPYDVKRIEADAKSMTAYLERRPAAAYPYDNQVRMLPEKAEAGKGVFDRVCAPCHGSDSPRVGRPAPVSEVQTDPEYAMKLAGRKARDQAAGYTVPHLDGIWLRGPYLHNGSVPSIRDLLSPAEQRPKSFYRGYDVLDPVNLGFVSREDGRGDVRRRGALFDVTKPGNSNRGHEYGVDLPEEEKDALIEFMKTL